MKKSILILFLVFITKFSFSLSFTVTACSFADSALVPYGSAQWIDTKVNGGYTSSDHMKIYLTHMVGTSTTTFTVIFDTTYWNYYLNLPVQADGSRRTYFTMPANYTPGYFQISVNLNIYSKRYGLFSIATGIENNSLFPKKEIKSVIYYDMDGRQTESPKGLFIKETYFTDETVRRDKFYLVE